VGRQTFEAELFDPAHPSVIEHGEFSISELPPDELALLRPGAIFYWMIGYRDLSTRQRRRESIIWISRSGRMGQDKFQATLNHIETIWNDLIADADAVSQRERFGEEQRTVTAEVHTQEEDRFVAQQGNVLLVEEEDKERALNAHELFLRGYDVIEATNAVEALTKMEQQHVDLVVLDVTMPDVDGATLLNQLRQITPDVPIVWVSGHGYHALDGTSVKGKRPNVLRKPFRPDELLTAVNDAMLVQAFLRDNWRRR
jgi:CheY-like chemotaxis protein